MKIKYYDDYDMKEYWEDNDNQDGTYFRKHEKPYKEEFSSEDNIDRKHEEKKHKAALYIRAHFVELMKDEAYKKAYYEIIDQTAREIYYFINDKPLAAVSDEQRELEGFSLDLEIKNKGIKNINKYKSDAAYIVEWVISGKNLTAYL